MLVREIMTSPAYRVLEGATVEAALQVMATASVSSLPVVDPSEHVVGIISEADLLKDRLEPDPRAHMRLMAPPSGTSAPKCVLRQRSWTWSARPQLLAYSSTLSLVPARWPGRQHSGAGRLGSVIIC